MKRPDMLPYNFQVSIGQFRHSMFGGLVSKPHSRHFILYRTKGHKMCDETPLHRILRGPLGMVQLILTVMIRLALQIQKYLTHSPHLTKINAAVLVQQTLHHQSWSSFGRFVFVGIPPRSFVTAIEQARTALVTRSCKALHR